MVEEEKAAHLGEPFDEFELENRILNDEEKKVLHGSIISHAKEKLGTQRQEIGEGSGVEHHATSFETITSSRFEPAPVTEPQLVPAYDLEQPHLSPIKEYSHEAIQPTAGQTEEGTLNESHMYLT